MKEKTAGFSKILGLIVRRERLISPIWCISLSVFSLLIMLAYPNLFSASDTSAAFFQIMENPAMKVMVGVPYGHDAITDAIMMASMCLIWVALAVALMNIFFVNRHLRADEELGRHELLRSLPLGRATLPISTLAAALILNLIISVLIALSLIASRVPSVSSHGAFIYGFACGGVGFAFAAFSALFCQINSSSKGVLASSVAALIACFMLRAIGDTNPNLVSLSFISPLGLAIRTFSFYENNLLPVFILFLEGIAIAILALFLSSKRDLGAGLIPARLGRAYANPSLLSPLGLSVRLLRGSIFAWASGVFLVMLSYGTVFGDLDAFIGSNDTIREMVLAQGSASNIFDGFITMISAITALIAGVPVIITAQRIFHEEKHGRLEHIVAAKVHRLHIMCCYILIAFLIPILLQFLAAVGLFLSASASGVASFRVFIYANLVYIPAQWLLAGICFAITGLAPKFSKLIWALFAYSFVVIYFGRLLKLPLFMSYLTPYGRIPQLPVADMNWLTLAILSVLSICLSVLGLVGFTNRDVITR